MPDSVHQRLRAAVEASGLTMTAVARKCGIPYRTLQDYVAGKRAPGAENLAKIAIQLHLSVDWILTGMEPGADRVAESPAVYGLDDVSEKVLDMLRTMDAAARRDVLKYAEDKKLAEEHRREIKLKKEAG